MPPKAILLLVKRPEPIHYLWWLVSRASGIVALVVISLTLVLGLAMAARLVGGPFKRSAARVHEHLALIGLAAIAVHGASLLGDQWLRPGLRGVMVPFWISYRPAFTGLGIISGYLVLLLGPSFYLRRRIGARLWRRLHRAIVLAWMLAAIHTLGSGSDGTSLWLRCIVLVPVIPIVYALVVRMLGEGSPALRSRSRLPRARRPEEAFEPSTP